jgi:uncharacterized protein YcnI
MKYFLVALLPVVLCAHAVVMPAASKPGMYERYVLRVPNESDNPTVRIVIRFPAEVRVISFAEVPGWRLAATWDSTGRASSATWTGTLPPERFVEFPFVAVNPKGPGNITWPVTQTYANGQHVEWIGPRNSENPASITVIATESAVPKWLPTAVAALALLVALLAFMSASRRPPGVSAAA